jgi:hypothetical protein
MSAISERFTGSSAPILESSAVSFFERSSWDFCTIASVACTSATSF